MVALVSKIFQLLLWSTNGTWQWAMPCCLSRMFHEPIGSQNVIQNRSNFRLSLVCHLCLKWIRKRISKGWRMYCRSNRRCIRRFFHGGICGLPQAEKNIWAYLAIWAHTDQRSLLICSDCSIAAGTVIPVVTNVWTLSSFSWKWVTHGLCWASTRFCSMSSDLLENDNCNSRPSVFAVLPSWICMLSHSICLSIESHFLHVDRRDVALRWSSRSICRIGHVQLGVLVWRQ